jgi:hypothetical protein
MVMVERPASAPGVVHKSEQTLCLGDTMAILDEILGHAKRVVVGAVLKMEVVSLLRSPVVGKIDFKYDKFTVTGADYRKLADDIVFGKVGVFADTLSAGAGAEYHQLPGHDHPNSLVLPASWNMIGMDVWRRMSVVHEATHALQDKIAKNMNEVAAEAPAFVAEALFVRLDGKTHPIFNTIKKAPTYNETRVVYRRAWLAAEELLGPPKRKEVASWRVKHINEAVHAHSLYDRGSSYTFDGI